MSHRYAEGIKVVWKNELDHDSNTLGKEEGIISSAINHPARKLHFELGRQALKEALCVVGFQGDLDLARGEKGEPILPPGYCGSITHSKNTAVAAAASKSEIIGLGLDIEHKDRFLSENTNKAIAGEKEISWILAHGGNERKLMLVSAKEALYKMLYPICKVYFGMLDAELTWEEESSSFRALLLKDLSSEFPRGSEYKIHTSIQNEFIVSLACLNA